MRLYIFLFSIFLVASCNDRNQTTSNLFLRYENQTSQQLSISVFPIRAEYGEDTLWLTLSPGQRFVSEAFTSEEFLYDKDAVYTFDPGIYPVFFLDSAKVVFIDSLSVTHYSRLITYDSLQSPTAPVYYPEARNIFNFDNYSIEKIGQDDFEATYIFTESDLNYADSIHQ